MRGPVLSPTRSQIGLNVLYRALSPKGIGKGEFGGTGNLGGRPLVLQFTNGDSYAKGLSCLGGRG